MFLVGFVDYVGDFWGHIWRLFGEVLGCLSYSFGVCLGGF